MKQGDVGYDPRRSRVSEGTMGDWMRGDINGTITEVPGIGPAAAKKLANGETPDECITNTYQLIGKVSMFCFVYRKNDVQIIFQ